jgi:twitching motility protein PilT
MDINALLKFMVEREVSDVHFKADSVPVVRFHGKLAPAGKGRKMSSTDVESLLSQVMTPAQIEAFGKSGEMDMAYALPGVSRFRVNVYRQRGTVALSLRVVPLKNRSFSELNLPVKPLTRLLGESRGLILFAGVTGAGKTTSMNSFVQKINESQACRIVTVEDPIEFCHPDIRSSVVQREVGRDTESFAQALKHVLRQDPDVVVIGEMRDAETMHAALTAAETGHLVLSTIHTMDASQTLDRVVDAFPAHQERQVRAQISRVLKGVLAQRLVPAKDGKGRLPAVEVLVSNASVRRLMLEGKNAELLRAMESGDFYGMRTFDQDLARLFQAGLIEEKDALENATNPDDISLKIRGAGGA